MATTARYLNPLYEATLNHKDESVYSSWTDNFDFAFAHKDRLCSPFGKRVHDPSAPYDAYDETDDTKEKAQAGRLKGIGR